MKTLKYGTTFARKGWFQNIIYTQDNMKSMKKLQQTELK